jgi:hypothetical protein
MLSISSGSPAQLEGTRLTVVNLNRSPAEAELQAPEQE